MEERHLSKTLQDFSAHYALPGYIAILLPNPPKSHSKVVHKPTMLVGTYMYIMCMTLYMYISQYLYCSAGYIFRIIKELLDIDSRDDGGGRVRSVLLKRVKQTHGLVLKLQDGYKHRLSTYICTYGPVF